MKVKNNNKTNLRAISVLVSALAVFVSATFVMSCTGKTQGTADTSADAAGYTARYTEQTLKYHDTDFFPHTSPDGKKLTAVSNYDFSDNGYGFVYNYDWASYTYALDYGTHTEGSNALYRLRTCGGGLQPRIYAYAANGDDISSSGWVSMYVDMRGLADPSDNSVGFYLYLSTQPKLDDQASSSSAPLFLREGSTGYYYNVADGEWKRASVSGKVIDVGADFAGYVCFPLSSFEHVKEDGRKYVSTAADAQGLFSAGYKYLCRVWTFCNIADAAESHTEILFDDITFYTAGAAHSHSFAFSETVAPTCTEYGYDVYECSECGQKNKQNITEPSGHSLTDAATSGGVSFYSCNSCAYAERSSTEGAPCTDKVYTVTFKDSKTGAVTLRLYREGERIRYEDIPAGGIYYDRYTYQFNAWTKDAENILPLDPDGYTVEGDMTFYTRYLISDYADKYVGAISVLAQNGGPYVTDEGRVVVLGNSNMALYHGLESSFASSKIPVYNNSVAGSTSYEMIEWFKVLIAPYKPCAVVLNVTTNDMAYYNLTEKQILENMITLYELSREYLPETQVFFVSGNPLPGRTEYTETIVRTNNAVARFCASAEKCEFIDVYAKVLAIAEKYPTGWDTWTHMNQSNLKIMFDDIKAAILAWKTNEGILF